MKQEDLIIIQEVLEKEITNLKALNMSDVNAIETLERKLSNDEENIFPRCREYAESLIRDHKDSLEWRRRRLCVVEKALLSILQEDTNEVRV